MNAHPFDTLPLENNGRLIFTPCPGTKEASLSDSISTLKQAGVNMLITLMDDKEMQENNALSLPVECSKQGLDWIQLPIPDNAPPSKVFEEQWHKQIENILNSLNSNGSIAVHCKGGSGRTGLTIALILAAYGWPTDKVIKEVQKIRPNALKHPQQLSYFKDNS